MSKLAHGHGIATLAGSSVLDVWFPAPSLGALVGALEGEADSTLTQLAGEDVDRGITR